MNLTLIYRTLAAGIFVAVSVVVWANEEQQATSTVEAAIGQANLLSVAFRDASDRVIPATVKVETIDEHAASTRRGIFPFDVTPRELNMGLGTGIIINAKGHILTNYHVIEGATKIRAILADGREYEVIDKKFDRDSDLALLTISPTSELAVAKFSDSDNVNVGDWVLAVGNPFDLESTVSAGIISARWRTISDITRGDFIQTDAAINPGNSGGPLINLRGEVIGINTAIYSRTGSNSGVGFAIASNTAKWVAEQLAAKGSVERAYLGVHIDPVSAKIAAELGAKPKIGVYVSATNENTPARNAGVLPKDIILKFNGRPVNSPTELQTVVERSDVNQEYEITILRDKKEIAFPIKVAIMPKSAQYTSSSNDLLGGQAKFYRDNPVGIIVIPLNPQSAQGYVYEGLEGMIILDVVSGSLAAKEGMKPQMLITKVDGKDVRNRDDYVNARKESNIENGITFSVETEDGSKVIVIKRKTATIESPLPPTEEEAAKPPKEEPPATSDETTQPAPQK